MSAKMPQASTVKYAAYDTEREGRRGGRGGKSGLMLSDNFSGEMVAETRGVDRELPIDGRGPFKILSDKGVIRQVVLLPLSRNA